MTRGFFTGGTPQGLSPVFILQLKMQGSLFCQAERKESPSTLIPDLDNANVGTFVSVTGNFQIGGFPYFYFRSIPVIRKQRQLKKEEPRGTI